MGRGVSGGRGGNAGGIAGLVQLIDEHGAALEYDLLTMTRYQLRDVGGTLPWGALLHFVSHLPRTSALSQEIRPISEEERWARGDYTAAILADLFDVVVSGFIAIGNRGSRRKPHAKPYPRPWMKPQTRHVGKGAIPIKDFERWWNSHGKQRN